MFKKAHDKMFKKAQMKLFTMIVSILLAVFVALISSINVITKAVMRGQSKEVLMQIASGIEYDEKEARFKYAVPMSNEIKDDRRLEKEKKPSETKPTDPTTTEKPSSTQAQTTAEKTKEKVTDAPTDPAQEETQVIEENQESYDEPHDEQPAETVPPETQAPATQAPETQAPSADASSGATPSWDQGGWDWSNWNNGDQNNGQWNGQWGDPNNGQWNGQWGDQNNGQWNGQWGDQNNNGQWNGQWGDPNAQGTYPWYTWMWGYYPWVWEQTKAYSSEYPVTRNDHGENDPRYDTINDHGEMDPRYDNVSEEKATDADEKKIADKTAYSYSDDMSAYIKPLANRTELSAASSDATSVQQNYQSRQNTAVNAPKEEPIPKSLGSIEFFVIMADKNGKYLDAKNNDDMNAETAQNYITRILEENIDTGMVNSYQFYQTSKPNGTLMVFTDKSYEMDMLRQLKRTTVIIGSIALVILSVLAYFLSKRSIQPIKTAFDKQKQFVSDASHELKTPLTVISANADVLEGEIGDNKWLKYIKAQTDRMSILVNDLLNLTRLENNNTDLERKYFNLSKAIVNTALPFECQAFENNKKFEVNVDEDVMLCGSEKHIKQMAAIFIDNALKYSNDGGTVRVTLKKTGDRKLFSVYNTGDGIKEEETDKIFERFYRSDQSRNRATGGYGLGLAIAKSIIDKHKFKVHIMNQPGKSVCFVITM
ncbi:His Kinase A (phospho-acceptor) domain-containing protein [Ruminococcus flavefaciens]|uniref:histidine kinase n=1 Tax=Ruminococcus flavefaciens TaxID=1265 RepID=A0A1H6L4X8_RUMFL|nr:ATP-binding protein [Ruminococcus flavefaciens]SEH80318.1 His Kinase A (phospho-acceptor) domain-containing protein [Ruminococcus flavefaciens]